MNGYRNGSSNYNAGNKPQANSLPPIVLDYKKDPNLFDTTAKTVADIGNKSYANESIL